METNKHVDLVAEAEQIIINCMEKPPDSIHAYLAEPIIWGYKSKFEENHKLKKLYSKFRYDFMLYIFMFAACIALAAIFTLGLLGRG